MLYEGVSARPTTIPLAEVRESVSGQPMSAAGQSRHFGRRPTTSVMLSTTEVGRLTLGAMLGVIGIVRIAIWQQFGLYDYGEHWVLIGLTVAAALVGIVTFGSLTGSMLPFILQRIGFDPASASAPFVATLVDVTGLVIYFSVASLILKGTLL